MIPTMVPYVFTEPTENPKATMRTRAFLFWNTFFMFWPTLLVSWASPALGALGGFSLKKIRQKSAITDPRMAW